MDSNQSQIISYIIPVNDLAIATNVEDLTCIICLNVCFKPVIISCCERLICLECIKMMLKHSAKCPYCNNININFEKPSKLIYRLFENLTFNCVNKKNGCEEKIKYYFYFDHIYNNCNYKKENEKLSFCKTCEVIYEYTTDTPVHDCEKSNNVNIDTDSMNELEKRLYELSLNITNSPSTLNSTTKNSREASSNTVLLTDGTINIPRY